MTWSQIAKAINNGQWVRRKSWPLGKTMKYDSCEGDVVFCRDNDRLEPIDIRADDWETNGEVEDE